MSLDPLDLLLVHLTEAIKYADLDHRDRVVSELLSLKSHLLRERESETYRARFARAARVEAFVCGR